MSLVATSKYLVGVVAVLALGASTALAQDTTHSRATSSRRIPIQKEGFAPRVDTVTVSRTDTVTVAGPTTYVHDTVRVEGPTRTVHDTVTVTVFPKPTPPRIPDGFYGGIAGGGSLPYGAAWIPNSAGWTMQGQFGYQGAKQLLGARIDANYAQPGQDSQFARFQPNPDIWNFSADLKLQLPWLTRMMGTGRRFALYGIGGYTLTTFRNLPFFNNSNVFVPGSGSWQNQSGWNLGGGGSLMWGRTELFLESRVLSFNMGDAPATRQAPTVFGINFYGF